jgi:hypothetical protein
MASPRLTIVLVSRTGLRESRPTLDQLRRQTLASDLEVLLVAPAGAVDRDELAAVTGFESVRLIEREHVVNRGEAAAHALLQARAPLAGPRENHSFFERDALEKLTEDWRPDDAAIAPAVRSANPETRRSLSMYLATYGPVAVPAEPAPRDDLPHHTAIFRSDRLRELGDRLPTLMRDESQLHRELRQRGFTLRVRPDAVLWHVNEARWVRAVTDPFMLLGMKLGAARAGSWSLARRLAYVLAGPAIFLLRLRGLIAMGRRADDTRGRLSWLLPMMTFTALVAALGETWGYIRPATPIPEGMEIHEFHIRGRLAGVPLTSPWLRDLLVDLPANLD